MTYIRRKTKTVTAAHLTIGSAAPIRIQTMANTDTNDTDGSVEQAKRCVDAGAELLRFTTQGVREVDNLKRISRILHDEGCGIPLVADIHFNANVAEAAARCIDKVRINPGNFVAGNQGDYTDEEWYAELDKIRRKLHPVLENAKAHGTAIRIGVNHGSLSPRIMSRYGNTPLGLATSCMEFIQLCEKEDFHNLVLSVKASNTIVMIHAVRLLVQMMDEADIHYPLHLGVTEAGSDTEGRIKSAVGIGTLLHAGIGDTIRVSLSEAPEAEVPVARALVRYVESEYVTADNDFDLARLATQFSRRRTDGYGLLGGSNPVRVIGNTPTSADIALHADLMMSDIAQDVNVIYASRSPRMLTIRHAIDGLDDDGDRLPVVASISYPDISLDQLQLRAAADFGPLLIDGRLDGINIACDNPHITESQLVDTAYAILQAARARISATEYISCPSCGRTKFDLPTVVRQVKEATRQYTGLKIAVMGCIVNGPGEMADADFGYIGAGMGRVSLFHKAVCVEKNIPEADALNRLIALIEANR